jgi:hypothetical protein
MNTEEALIRAFVEPSMRARLVGFLSSPTERPRLRAELTHARYLDRRFAQTISDAHRTPAEIEDLLRTMGAPETCELVSEDEDLDGLELRLRDALEWVVGSGMATFVSCIPGKLAYFEGDDPEQRYILERGAG